MRLSVKSEYALLALGFLSNNYGKGLVKIENIANKFDIPQKYLEQILLTLRKAGYLQSKRGASGGYSLSKSPENIVLADIIRLLDGPLAPINSVSKYFYANTPIEKNQKLMAVFLDIRNYTAMKLEKITLLDIT